MAKSCKYPKPIELRINDQEWTVYLASIETVQKDAPGACGYADFENKVIKVSGEGLSLLSTIMHELGEVIFYYSGCVYHQTYPEEKSLFSCTHTQYDKNMGEMIGLMSEICKTWRLPFYSVKTK